MHFWTEQIKNILHKYITDRFLVFVSFSFFLTPLEEITFKFYGSKSDCGTFTRSYHFRIFGLVSSLREKEDETESCFALF